ncbi:MAG TPA: FAD-binding oxidoreductase [Ilumatobacteraceae bacterium]|nr:FAD-binding oxidoreductase [Ilumatobacteraceae bacterium]HRA83705.1 FAD-binding oxidoreductase [Ilumatobacteraceae bacterium]
MLELPNHEVASALKEAGSRGALVRGLGRSYGDAAQNAGGLVLRLLGAAHQAVLDPQRATVTVPAGVSMDDLLRVIVPRGFFVPVTPGTRFVTIGGAIASDIHGKNHHGEGSFGNHVESLTMLLADGSQVVVGPQQRPELFWATVGGMGLTGVILDATISLIPIETSRMSVDTTRIADLDTLLATMTEGDDDYRYSVAWIDPQAKGRSLGRSVLGRGDHARLDQLGPKEAIEPLAYDAKQLVTVPPLVPPMGFINHATVAAFNEMWYRKAPRHRVGELQGIATFFHPLDMVSRWNRIYGAHGMLQYQVVVPFGAEETMRTVIERFAASGTASFLAVLKRFGPGSLAPMSFPAPGWTLTLDVPAATGGLGDLLHSLDRLVLDAGGRHYFAKDSVTTPEAIRRGYPRLAEWKAIRDAVDPTGLWQSDLSRRLGLTD